MKKFITLVLIVGAFLFLGGCQNNKYEEETGVYKLYSMTGDLNMSMFKTYNIELKTNGDMIVTATYSNNAPNYESKGTFEIKDEKIYFYTKSEGKTQTEEYDYINGEIHMNTTVQDVTIQAKFKRN